MNTLLDATALRRAYETSCALEPSIHLGLRLFAEGLRRRGLARPGHRELSPMAPPDGSSRQRDLYVAMGCDTDCPGAWPVFEQDYVPRVEGFLRQRAHWGAQRAEEGAGSVPGLLWTAARRRPDGLAFAIPRLVFSQRVHDPIRNRLEPWAPRRFTIFWRESQTRGDEPRRGILSEVCAAKALEVAGAMTPRGEGQRELAIPDLMTPERRARWRAVLSNGICDQGIRSWGELAGKRPASVPLVRGGQQASPPAADP